MESPRQSALPEPPKRYSERVYPTWAKPCSQPPFPQLGPQTARQKLGVRYERKVHRSLEERYGANYIPSQWWIYRTGEKLHYCQTDGILLRDSDRVLLLVECKYSHTSAAFWQLENLYVPVLKAFLQYSDWRVATCEVVKWFDPAVTNPRRVVLRSSLEDVKTGEYAVHILNRE